MNTNYGKTKLRIVDLSDNDHTDSIFDAVDWEDVDLSVSNLTRCTFKRAKLVRVDLSDCWVEDGDSIEELLKSAKLLQDVKMPDGSIKNPSPKEEPPKKDK